MAGLIVRESNKRGRLMLADYQTSSLVFPASYASLDLDFVNNVGYQKGKPVGTALSLITATRTTTANYINSSGVLTSAAINGKVLEYTSAGVIRGLRSEKARTNYIRNSTMQGAAAGSPGTLPTNWGRTGSTTGITQTIGTPGVVSGFNCLDITLAGTPSSGSIVYNFEAATAIAASAGQIWTHSFGIQLVGGDLTNVTGLRCNIRYNDSGGTQISVNQKVITVSSTMAIVENTFTIPAGSTAYVQGQIGINYTAGSPINFTLRIADPQMELGTGATSRIKTTSAAVSRGADNISLTDMTNVIAGEGFVYAEWQMGSDPAGAGVYALADNAGTSYAGLFYPSAGTSNEGSVAVGGVTQGGTLADTQLTSATNYKSAYSWDSAIGSRSTGGASQSTGYANFPSITKLLLGNGPDGASQLNGWLRRLIVGTKQIPGFRLGGI